MPRRRPAIPVRCLRTAHLTRKTELGSMMTKPSVTGNIETKQPDFSETAVHGRFDGDQLTEHEGEARFATVEQMTERYKANESLSDEVRRTYSLPR